MKRLKELLTPKTIRLKLVLSLLFSGLLLAACVIFLIGESLEQLEIELTQDRLTADISYIEDLIGEEGEWHIRRGGLYLGDILIGDGTEENANLTPFLIHEQKTKSFSYVFKVCSDEGLTWVGDKKTGYQQGHFIRVAGSTPDTDGSSLVGTYIDKKVADILDRTGTYSGEANVDGQSIYCLYNTLKDNSGVVQGAIVVGRSMEEMQQQARTSARKVAVVVVIVLILACIGLEWEISKWISAIHQTQRYLEKLEAGTFPEEPLVLNTRDEMSQMADSVNAMTEALREKERIASELSLANSIQAHMLPCIFPPFPEHDEMDIFATMNPAKEVGGDFYDFFMLDDTHLVVVIADVSGKGVPAALFMVIAKTLIKNYAQLGLSPGDVFTKVNELLGEGNDEGLFVTAWIGLLDLASGKLTYANAGHNPPMIMQKGTFTYLRSRPGFVLAGMSGVRYRQQELEMEPGDKLFLYTDGVTEATNRNKQLYGEERLSNFLNDHRDLTATATLHAVKRDIDTFVGEAEQFDDITMLMLEYRRKSGAVVIEKQFAAADSDLQNAIAFVEEELEKVDCPMKIMMQISVAVEEIFVNIAHYAYPDGQGDMTLTLSVFPDKMTLTFTDRGIPFDPLAKPDPNITLSAEERNIGGLGIFMVKKSMDDVAYARKNETNVFTIVKKFG